MISKETTDPNVTEGERRKKRVRKRKKKKDDHALIEDVSTHSDKKQRNEIINEMII